MSKIVYASDLHLRDMKPKKRTDDYLEAQFVKFEALLKEASENDVPLIIAGDFFDVPRFSEKRMARLIELIVTYEVEIYSVFGQHDVKNHNMEFWKESPLGNLILAELVFPLRSDPELIQGCWFYGVSWDEEIPIPLPQKKTDRDNILVIHELVVYKDEVFDDYVKAEWLLEDYPEYDLFLCGDNHEGFKRKKGGQVLLNTGSMMRNRVDQIEHKPHYYLIDLKEKTQKKIHYPAAPVEEIFDLASLKEEDVREEKKKDFTSLVGKIKSKKVRHDFKKVLKDIVKEAGLKKEEKTLLNKLVNEAEGK